MTDDRFDKLMRDAADTFRRPPEPPTEEMWAEIEARAGLESSTPAVPIASITPRVQARRGFRIPSWVGIAATLVIGIGIGRGSTVTLGATLPTYSTRATDPSGSGTFITWVFEAIFGVAAKAAPATARAAAPASAVTRSLLTKGPPEHLCKLRRVSENIAAL